jgi:uncharacterized protein YndB with AHSA1/START domain
MDTLELTARRGLFALLLPALSATLATAQINEAAPVLSRDTILINAPAECVWTALSDLSGWPSRFDFITLVKAPARLEAQQRFHWHTTKLHLTSTLLVVKPPQELGWKGRKYGVLVFHQWRLLPAPNGGTLVVTEESQQGLPVRLLKDTFHQRLKEGAQRWLTQLKTYCEKPLTAGR